MPRSLVATLREMFVATFRMVTVARDMPRPAESDTTPRMTPVVACDCAWRTPGRRRSHPAKSDDLSKRRDDGETRIGAPRVWEWFGTSPAVQSCVRREVAARADVRRHARAWLLRAPSVYQNATGNTAEDETGRRERARGVVPHSTGGQHAAFYVCTQHHGARPRSRSHQERVARRSARSRRRARHGQRRGHAGDRRARISAGALRVRE